MRSRFLSVWILAAATLAAAATARADRRIAPDDIPGVQRVDAAGVIRLADTAPHLVIIDSRIAMDRRQGYIEGSVSLPDVDTRCTTLARVAPARNRPVLFYCNGPRCGRSAIAARIAHGCGYRSIYWYRDGFEDWKTKGYPYLKTRPAR
jgi:rhodanese-related sulfurtransferase